MLAFIEVVFLLALFLDGADQRNGAAVISILTYTRLVIKLLVIYLVDFEVYGI